jgi:alkanesulfonate monooxygenase SsuD/methylene tetrahydromethanopterin reductase-like flavin-dependent oxidoreductase (luciferase family)
MATKTLKIGIGVCLIAQRDPIQTAKLVASIDQVSNGRFRFGVGDGWNQDEIENHGDVFKTRHKRARPRVDPDHRVLAGTRFRSYAPLPRTWGGTRRVQRSLGGRGSRAALT